MIEHLQKKNISYTLIDLREIDMPFCDGRKLEEYKNQALETAFKTLSAADGYIIGMPVYNYSISGPLKNFLDLTDKAMVKKPVGIVCNSGGVRSYLASADLMKCLSFEVESVCIQPTVHTWAGDFEKNVITNERIPQKIEDMIEKLLAICH